MPSYKFLASLRIWGYESGHGGTFKAWTQIWGLSTIHCGHGDSDTIIRQISGFRDMKEQTSCMVLVFSSRSTCIAATTRFKCGLVINARRVIDYICGT